MPSFSISLMLFTAQFGGRANVHVSKASLPVDDNQIQGLEMWSPSSEKPQEHSQGAQKHSFKLSSPGVCGLEKTGMDESVSCTGPFEYSPGIQRGPARKSGSFSHQCG